MKIYFLYKIESPHVAGSLMNYNFSMKENLLKKIKMTGVTQP
jgi:hypothetical protein